jgi:hypothetical protein
LDRRFGVVVAPMDTKQVPPSVSRVDSEGGVLTAMKELDGAYLQGISRDRNDRQLPKSSHLSKIRGVAERRLHGRIICPAPYSRTAGTDSALRSRPARPPRVPRLTLLRRLTYVRER